MKNWLKKLNKFAKLSFRLKTTFLLISFYLLCCHFLLKLLPFSTFKYLYNFLSKSNNQTAYSEQFTYEIIYLLEASANHLPFTITCLPRALVAKYLFRKDPSVLIRIGVQMSNSVFEAHAWIEKHNRIIMGEQPNSTFQAIWNWE